MLHTSSSSQAPVASRRIKKGATQKRAQTLVEYALILAMISILSILVLQQLGTTLRGLWQYITNNVAQANSASF
ncbi:hypothetical protein DB346_21025 [Verrucomicrobia bacterium LW23]|nr:hypothetical protein DB346_21025 [Verrucomicrobia bacterium LW23]